MYLALRPRAEGWEVMPEVVVFLKLQLHQATPYSVKPIRQVAKGSGNLQLERIRVLSYRSFWLTDSYIMLWGSLL